MQPNPGQPPAADLNSIPQARPRAWRRWVALAAAVVVTIIAIMAWRWSRPPRVVRLLPPGQTLVYLNMKPLRVAGWLTGGKLPTPAAPAYQSFVQDSGFDYTRDLDALACSLRGAPLKPSETTCALEGRFGARFAAWLKAHAQRVVPIGSGHEAYQFPGWAQPQRPMYVFLPDAQHLVATNTANPGTVAQRTPATPPLWRHGLRSAPPLGYLAVNVLDLAATRQLDGTAAPWRGARAIRAQVRLSAGAVTVSGTEEMTTADEAAAARDWMRNLIDSAENALPADTAGKLSVRDVLRQTEIEQSGSDVKFGFTLAPGLL